MQERVPAQNIEAEQAVLGAILIDNSVMNKVAEILKSPDFTGSCTRLFTKPCWICTPNTSPST